MHWLCRARHYLEGPRRRQGKHLVRRAVAEPLRLCDDSVMEPGNTDLQEKRFHGWRLLGVIALVLIAIAGVSFVIDWAVLGPLEGRVF